MVLRYNCAKQNCHDFNQSKIDSWLISVKSLFLIYKQTDNIDFHTVHGDTHSGLSLLTMYYSIPWMKFGKLDKEYSRCDGIITKSIDNAGKSQKFTCCMFIQITSKVRTCRPILFFNLIMYLNLVVSTTCQIGIKMLLKQIQSALQYWIYCHCTLSKENSLSLLKHLNNFGCSYNSAPIEPCIFFSFGWELVQCLTVNIQRQAAHASLSYCNYTVHWQGCIF